MEFEAYGESYVIMRFNEDVSEEYVRELAELIKSENIAQYNGYNMKNNVEIPSYSLYVKYTSGEKLTIYAGGNAADTCVFDLNKLLEHAAKQELRSEYY